MGPAQYLTMIREESAALVDSAQAAGLDTPVPSCPDWTVADLLGHIGRVQRWAADVVERRATEPVSPPADPPADPAARVAWAEAGTDRLVAVLGATPPDAPVWTFTGLGTAAFWLRRQAHEAALHRVDADLAAGRPPAMSAAVARDGIDEFLDVVVSARLADRLAGDGETLHFHATDGEGEWLVRLGPDGPEVTRSHAKGDVAARGSASDLLLVVRGRIGSDAVEVFGDEALLGRFVDSARV